MDIHDLSRYAKLVARARDTASSPEERQTARQAMTELEDRHPGIQLALARAEKAITRPVVDEPTNPNKPPTNWGSVIESVLTNVARQTTTSFADEFAGHVTGSRRTDTLRRGKCVLEQHTCAPGQVCLEIRANADDILKTGIRRRYLEALEDRLLQEARDA